MIASRTSLVYSGIVTLIAVLVVSLPVLALTPFVSETVDETGTAGQFTSLALDAQGNPHISHHFAGNGDLRYSVKLGGTWMTEDIETAGIIGLYTSIAVDAQGNPHISYYDSTNDDLKYAVKSAGSWTIQTVDAAGDVGLYTSIALDAQGNPHISYRDVTSNALKYAVDTGGGWTTQTVDATAGAGFYTSIVLDAQGKPHISYQVSGVSDLKYASQPGSSWTTEVVDNTGFTGAYTSIDVDAQDRPHISYKDISNLDLKYTTKSTGSWTFETVDATGDLGEYSALKLDVNGNPHISYYDLTNFDLKYAAKTAGSWSTEAVDVSGLAGAFSSIAIDAQGLPHISYYHLTNSALKYTNAALHLSSPNGGEQWPVGGVRSVDWNGGGAVDILLSVDGGSSFDLLKSSVSGGIPTGGSFDLLVPHTPSRFCVVKIERSTPFATSESDSFFTIEASVSLLNLSVYQPEGLPGLTVQWDTDPGPKDLAGYRLEKKGDVGTYYPLFSRTSATSYHDADGRAGDTYRLFAINGLGEESYLGETRSDRAPALRGGLAVYPLPFRGGELTIEFATTSVGGEVLETEIAIYDVTGRKVRTIASGHFAPPSHRITWDGKDTNGADVASGIYFIRESTSISSHTRKLVIVR